MGLRPRFSPRTLLDAVVCETPRLLVANKPPFLPVLDASGRATEPGASMTALFARHLRAKRLRALTMHDPRISGATLFVRDADTRRLLDWTPGGGFETWFLALVEPSDADEVRDSWLVRADGSRADLPSEPTALLDHLAHEWASPVAPPPSAVESHPVPFDGTFDAAAPPLLPPGYLLAVPIRPEQDAPVVAPSSGLSAPARSSASSSSRSSSPAPPSLPPAASGGRRLFAVLPQPVNPFRVQGRCTQVFHQLRSACQSPVVGERANGPAEPGFAKTFAAALRASPSFAAPTPSRFAWPRPALHAACVRVTTASLQPLAATAFLPPDLELGLPRDLHCSLPALSAALDGWGHWEQALWAERTRRSPQR